MALPTTSNLFPQITLRRPLVALNMACAVLDRDPRAILNLIDCGELLWAFNLATDSRTKREIRILAHCLLGFQNGQAATNRELKFADVLNLIFPMAISPQGDAVTKLKANTVSRALCIDGGQTKNLVLANHLRLIPGSKYRSGPGGSPFIEFSSVVKFLENRRII